MVPSLINPILACEPACFPLLGAGVLLPRADIERASALCSRAGVWLILDNTYEDFVYEGRQHAALGAPHVLHIFSFSKV